MAVSRRLAGLKNGVFFRSCTVFPKSQAFSHKIADFADNKAKPREVLPHGIFHPLFRRLLRRSPAGLPADRRLHRRFAFVRRGCSGPSFGEWSQQNICFANYLRPLRSSTARSVASDKPFLHDREKGLPATWQGKTFFTILCRKRRFRPFKVFGVLGAFFKKPPCRGAGQSPAPLPPQPFPARAAFSRSVRGRSLISPAFCRAIRVIRGPTSS